MSQHMSKGRQPHPHEHKNEEQIDHTVEESFPASDPAATGGKTRIETDDDATRRGKDTPREHDAKQDRSH
jgi:hypothetical protein